MKVDSDADVTVSWAPMDGPSGTLAATGISFNPATKTIVSATLTFDSDDNWTVYASITCGTQNDGQDVENVGAHEFGHVIGLAHIPGHMESTMNLIRHASHQAHRAGLWIISDSIGKRFIILVSRLADSWRSDTLSFLPFPLGIASASGLVPANVTDNFPTPVAFWQLRTVAIQQLDLYPYFSVTKETSSHSLNAHPIR